MGAHESVLLVAQPANVGGPVALMGEYALCELFDVAPVANCAETFEHIVFRPTPVVPSDTCRPVRHLCVPSDTCRPVRSNETETKLGKTHFKKLTENDWK